MCTPIYSHAVKNVSPQNGGFILGHFGWYQTPAARNFARLQGVRTVFSTANYF
jgi:hypothetical protein